MGISNLLQYWRVKRRIKKLKKLGLDFDEFDMNKLINPNLSTYELEKLNSDEIPSEEEVKKYYKMYLIKFKLDRKDEWSVETPMPFEEFRKKSLTPTETLTEDSSDFGIVITGGYLFMIPQTCDSMIGIPPYQSI